MNIFMLDGDPKIAAQSHCDKHIVKMPLETAQLMCTALWLNGVPAHYKQTHINHPMSIWVRQGKINWEWTYELGIYLCKEYTFRYGRRHACQSVIERCMNDSIYNCPQLSFHLGNSGNIVPLCMPDQYKVVGDPVQSYRNYYIFGKRDIATWNKTRAKPTWYP